MRADPGSTRSGNAGLPAKAHPGWSYDHVAAYLQMHWLHPGVPHPAEDKVQQCHGLRGQAGAVQEAPGSSWCGSHMGTSTAWELVSGEGIQVVGLLDDIYREPEFNVTAGVLSAPVDRVRCRGPLTTRGNLDRAGGKARAADVLNRDQGQAG